jgi:nuclear GTP-binding protein
LDCPGIVFSSGEGSDFSSADIVLRNAVEMEKIPDPVSVIDSVLKRCPRERLMELYQIPVYRSADEFLAFVAHKIGKLKKGGIPDYHAAAVSVLRDWQVCVVVLVVDFLKKKKKKKKKKPKTKNKLQSGKIKFYTMPPERNSAIVSSEIVTQWAKEFDLDAIVAKEESIVGLLPMDLDGTMRLTESVHRSDGAYAVALHDGEEMEEGDDDDGDDEEEEEEEEGEAEEMELSSEAEDEYAQADTGRGKMMMVMPTQQGKRRDQGGNNNNEEAELAGAAMSKGKKKKLLKRMQKRSKPEDEEGDLVEEQFDFDEFVPTAISDQTPDAEEFEFKY